MSEREYDTVRYTQRVELGLNTMSSAHRMVDIEFRHHTPHPTADEREDLLIAQLRFAMARTHTETQTLRTETVPTTAWQHLKAARFPRWWLRRWPARVRTLRIQQQINVYNTCPHLDDMGIRPTAGCREIVMLHALPSFESPANWDAVAEDNYKVDE